MLGHGENWSWGQSCPEPGLRVAWRVGGLVSSHAALLTAPTAFESSMNDTRQRSDLFGLDSN